MFNEDRDAKEKTKCRGKVRTLINLKTLPGEKPGILIELEK